MKRPSDSAFPEGSAACDNGAGQARRPIVTRAEIDAAFGYIQRHACEGLTARRVVMETQQVTLATFSKHFLAATGFTLLAAIRQRQLEEARRLLLRTEFSPGFIAEHCGFRDLRAAARAFTEAGCEVPHALRSPNGTPASPAPPRRPAKRQRG